MLDSHTKYDDKTLDSNFGGEYLRSIEHETDVKIDLPSRKPSNINHAPQTTSKAKKGKNN